MMMNTTNTSLNSNKSLNYLSFPVYNPYNASINYIMAFTIAIILLLNTTLFSTLICIGKLRKKTSVQLFMNIQICHLMYSIFYCDDLLQKLRKSLSGSRIVWKSTCQIHCSSDIWSCIRNVYTVNRFHARSVHSDKIPV